MKFCEQNVSLTTIWKDGGFSPCFIYTLSSVILATYMLIFGGGQLLVYKYFSFRIDPRLKRTNCLFRMQINLHFLRVVFALLSIILLLVRSNKETFFGYFLAENLADIFVWTMCTVLIIVERNFDLPTPPSRGHGVILLLFYALEFIMFNVSVVSYNGLNWFWRLRNVDDLMKLVIFVVKYVCLIIIFALGIKAPGLPTLEERYQFAYSVLHDPETGGQQPESQGSTFKNAWRKLRTLLPYLWPKGSFTLQICVLICIVILTAGRVVNVYIPLYHKWIVDSLTSHFDGQKLIYRYDLILIYVALLLAQGGAMSGGMLSVMRNFLWIKVQQYTSREIQVHLYNHLHGLSLRWHLSRKTGEVLRVMDRGTNSINQLLSYLLFNIVPTVIDIIVAIIYFTSSFNIWFGLIVFVTMALYLSSTIFITEWRTKFRRTMNRLENATEAIAVDALLNFETVKYYNAEDYEVNRYREALLKYQDAEWLATASMMMLNFAQNFIITGGLLVGSMLCAWFVVEQYQGFTVGSYVLFATYIMQLYQPLNWLGTYYRVIQQSFVDMENMFELLKEKQDVSDCENAAILSISKGRIVFKDVSFRYSPERPILKHVSFTVEPGKSMALVGPTGSGKSTIMRLLFRFYDVDSGAITIDGVDISHVTQKSLRKHIGVVPQDTVLFNDTIMYNIRYGKVAASDDEVFDAAKAAEIHDNIQTFGEGYNTVVGERGLKLSGGEKQRVAIARTILKSPELLLLDEATSALDTNTERLIQSSLDKICVGRTTVIIAHRLSTIIHVDQILVLKDGEIVERGSHTELVEQGGVYANMWRQQLEKNAQLPNSDSQASIGQKPPAYNDALATNFHHHGPHA